MSKTDLEAAADDYADLLGLKNVFYTSDIREAYLVGAQSIEHARPSLSESERERVEDIKDSVNEHWFIDNPNTSDVHEEINFMLNLIDSLTGAKTT